MITFEKIAKYQEDEDVRLPGRKTIASAGYDFYAAEDTVIPSYFESYIRFYNDSFKDHFNTTDEMDKITHPIILSDLAKLTKEYGFKPTLVPTGVKCKIPDDLYLQLSVRSSLPLKHWLVLANGVGVIDADYADNPDNEGHIYFQLINLSPYPILIKKGDCFGQGIILPYYTCTNENGVTTTRKGGFGSTSNDK